MNPYQFVINSLFPTVPTESDKSGIFCTLSLAADAYSSGFVAGPGNGPHDYVLRQLRSRFGDLSPAVNKLAAMMGEKLGK